MPCVFILRLKFPFCSWRNEPAARPRSCDGHSRYHPQGPTGWDRRTIVLDLYAFLMQRMFGGTASNWKMVGKGASNEPARGAAMTSGPQLTNSLLRRAWPPR